MNDKYNIKEITKLNTDEQDRLGQIMFLINRSKSYWNDFNHEFCSIDDMHYAVIFGINNSIEQLNNNMFPLSPEEIEARVKYLTVLKEKIEKSKELLVFL